MFSDDFGFYIKGLIDFYVFRKNRKLWAWKVYEHFGTYFVVEFWERENPDDYTTEDYKKRYRYIKIRKEKISSLVKPEQHAPFLTDKYTWIHNRQVSSSAVKLYEKQENNVVELKLVKGGFNGKRD